MLAHDPADSLGHTNSTLTNNDDGEQAHALHQMRLLETEHSPDGGDTDDNDGLNSHDSVPYKIHHSVVVYSLVLECWGHGDKNGSGEDISANHETKRKQKLGITGSPGVEQDDHILNCQ